jgi:hypothetical protein
MIVSKIWAFTEKKSSNSLLTDIAASNLTLLTLLCIVMANLDLPSRAFIIGLWPDAAGVLNGD